MKKLFDKYGGPIRTVNVIEGRRSVKENFGFVTFLEAKSAKKAFKRLQNFMFLDGSVLELKFWEEKNAFS